MSDRTSLLKLLEAVEKHEGSCEGFGLPEYVLYASHSLWLTARSIRAKLDAQEKAEWEASYPHEDFEKAFGGSD